MTDIKKTVQHHYIIDVWVDSEVMPENVIYEELDNAACTMCESITEQYKSINVDGATVSYDLTLMSSSILDDDGNEYDVDGNII